jgi:hypothetical protein
VLITQSSKISIQQNAGSVTPPTGFINYLGVTSLSAYSVATGDVFGIRQRIEGLNISDLGWGTASAQAVTVSFWVRSSLTGTFGGSLQNSAGNRSYPFSYTISSANTWEQKTLNIAGDTSGTWLTTNGVGIELLFSLGAGATYSGTAGAWVGANYNSATGATSVVGTNGATFYITGVQLEAGSVASPFERRDYGRELMMCQRYYTTSFQNDAYPASPNSLTVAQTGGYFLNASTGGGAAAVWFPTPMRANPTVTLFAPLANPASGNIRRGSNGDIAAGSASFIGFRSFVPGGGLDGVAYQYGFTASAEL